MVESNGIDSRPGTEVRPDDLQRMLLLAQPDKDDNLPAFRRRRRYVYDPDYRG